MAYINITFSHEIYGQGVIKEELQSLCVRTVYQNSGDINSQWDHFVGHRTFYGMLPTISNGDTIGKSCDFWNRWVGCCHPAVQFQACALLCSLVSAILRQESREQKPL